jgi:hypothetical protein
MRVGLKDIVPEDRVRSEVSLILILYLRTQDLSRPSETLFLIKTPSTFRACARERKLTDSKHDICDGIG